MAVLKDGAAAAPLTLRPGTLPTLRTSTSAACTLAAWSPVRAAGGGFPGRLAAALRRVPARAGGSRGPAAALPSSGCARVLARRLPSCGSAPPWLLALFWQPSLSPVSPHALWLLPQGACPVRAIKTEAEQARAGPVTVPTGLCFLHVGSMSSLCTLRGRIRNMLLRHCWAHLAWAPAATSSTPTRAASGPAAAGATRVLPAAAAGMAAPPPPPPRALAGEGAGLLRRDAAADGPAGGRAEGTPSAACSRAASALTPSAPRCRASGQGLAPAASRS